MHTSEVTPGALLGEPNTTPRQEDRAKRAPFRGELLPKMPEMGDEWCRKFHQKIPEVQNSGMYRQREVQMLLYAKWVLDIFILYMFVTPSSIKANKDDEHFKNGYGKNRNLMENPQNI